MICNALCTVFRIDGDDIHPVWQGECMWQEVFGIEVKKYGAENSDKAAVFIPDINADICEGDIIIRGECSDGEYAARNGLKIMSAARNDFGSEDMRHIELGAR